jgi:hypothetical protein
MKKLLIAIIAAIFIAATFFTVAEARSGGMKWRHGGKHHGWNHRGWRGHHHGYRHGHRHHYRHYGHRHHGHHHGGWWGGWWGPGVVFAPGYYGGYDGYYDEEDVCYVRNVRRYDSDGQPYIRRVRVCE